MSPVLSTSLIGAAKKEKDEAKSEEAEQYKKDPTLPVCRTRAVSTMGQADESMCFSQARSHGNEPSKGAKIDAEIKAEEEEELRKKGKA